MASPKPSATPVTDIAQNLIALGASTEGVVKVSSRTYGRLVTLQESLAAKDSYFKGEVDFAEDYLERTRASLEKAGAERDAALKVRDEAVAELEPALRDLNIRSQEVSDMQDLVAIALAAVPLVAAAVLTAPVALVVGGAAAVGSFVNSTTGAGTLEEDLPGAGADLNANLVDMESEAYKLGGSRTYKVGSKVVALGRTMSKALPVVSAVATGVDVWESEGIQAKLDSVTNEGFNRLDAQIDKAGTFVDKDRAKAASVKARSAQSDLNRTEAVLKMRQAEYLRALRIAEGVTWVRPR